MANAKYDEIKKHKLYIIYHEQTLQFYIGITAAMDLSNVFSQHYSMRNECTKELFKEYRETVYCPQIFVLQKVSCTFSEATSRQIAFVKHFQEGGYTSLNEDYIIESANDLEEYTEEIYKDISEKSVEDYLSPANRICGNYGRKRKNESDNPYTEGKKQVKFFCTDEEYAVIQMNAKKHNLTVSAYLREVGLTGNIIYINYQAIVDHSKFLSKIKNMLISISNYYVHCGVAFPTDVDHLKKISEEVLAEEKKLYHATEKERQNLRKEIMKKIMK